MNIEELQTFVEISCSGGISSAALRLGVSKSIVSRRLVRLEENLGVQLFTRSTRGAALTEAGTTFRDYAAKVCADTEIAIAEILQTGDLRGRIRISAPLTFGPTHFAPALAELARRHPQLHIYTCYSDRVVDLITEGYDCGIRVGFLKDSTMIARRIGPIYGKLVASPDYIREHGEPEAPDEILGHQALLRGTEAWHVMDGDQIITVHPQGRFKADSGTALVAAAVAGLGIAWLPDCLTHEETTSGALVPVMTRYPPPPAGAYLIRPPGQYPLRKIRILTEFLIERFEQAPHLWDSTTKEKTNSKPYLGFAKVMAAAVME